MNCDQSTGCWTEKPLDLARSGRDDCRKLGFAIIKSTVNIKLIFHCVIKRESHRES
jgi:hypothetical protein